MIDRVTRLIGAAFGHWMEGGRDYPAWMRLYPHKSGERIKLTIGFYDVSHEYTGSVTVVEDEPGAELQFETDLPPTQGR